MTRLLILILLLYPIQINSSEAVYYNSKPAVEGTSIQYQIKHEIITQAELAGLDPQIALRIAQCESNFDPYAENPASSATGLYQFTEPTFEWIGGENIYDYKEQIRLFIKYYPQYPEWWVCT